MRPLSVLFKQPALCIALLNAAVGHAVMILVMVATPLAIVACGFSITQSTSVIGWHVFGMFLPAFFSGQLIDRYGTSRIAIVGALILIVSGGVALLDVELTHFYLALFLLGVGWNLLYLSGSTAITQCHQPQERVKVQGLSELLISILAAVAAFCSGIVLNIWGWQLVQITVIVLLVATIIANLCFANHG